MLFLFLAISSVIVKSAKRFCIGTPRVGIAQPAHKKTALKAEVSFCLRAVSHFNG